PPTYSRPPKKAASLKTAGELIHSTPEVAARSRRNTVNFRFSSAAISSAARWRTRDALQMAIPANARRMERARATASGHFALESRIGGCCIINHIMDLNATGKAATL